MEWKLSTDQQTLSTFTGEQLPTSLPCISIASSRPTKSAHSTKFANSTKFTYATN